MRDPGLNRYVGRNFAEETQVEILACRQEHPDWQVGDRFHVAGVMESVVVVEAAVNRPIRDSRTHRRPVVFPLLVSLARPGIEILEIEMPLANGGGLVTLPFEETAPGGSYILAFRALPLLIVIGAITSLLTYWRVLPFIVRLLSRALEKSMGVGGAVGWVSREDVIEEIVGEIVDWGEGDDPGWSRDEAGVYHVDARMDLDDLNEAIGSQLAKGDDYDTLGGWIYTRMGRVPAVGDTIDAEDAEIAVEKMDAHRILRAAIRLEADTHN